MILVKLWQFHPQDQERTVLDINQESLAVARGRPDPFSVRLLQQIREGEVAAWAAEPTTMPTPAGAGFVLEGSFQTATRCFRRTTGYGAATIPLTWLLEGGCQHMDQIRAPARCPDNPAV